MTDKFDEKITHKDMKRKMRLWRKTTSTSPSGRYVGHYKILSVPINSLLSAKE